MHFIRLIRPINLLIIALTMFSARYFLIDYEKISDAELSFKEGESFDFFLLVFSTILIAAAGNIINDYFDVKADRINKPEKLIITKYIKRRWAIISHWMLNVIAFSIAIYLSSRNDTFWYVFIHLLTINLLWFYSAYFKRKPIIGNFIIAGLTALVMILCGVHFYYHSDIQIPTNLDNTNALNFWINKIVQHGNFIVLMGFFAFANNFSREIIKDIEDIEGDVVLGAKTFPIIYGKRKSKLLAILTLTFSPIFFFAFIQYHLGNFNGPIIETLKVFLPIVLALILNFISIINLIKAQNKSSLKRSDLFLKIAMLLGILQPFYWLILI